MRNILIAAAAVLSIAANAAATVHHRLIVRLDPATGRLEATATVTAPPSAAPLEFLLAGTLEITASTPPVDRVPSGDPPVPPRDAAAASAGDTLARYRTRTPFTGSLTLAYRGAIAAALTAQKEEYTRGFRETTGLIGPEGVYLAGASGWYPQVGTGLVTFDLEAHAPDGWHLISQGDGSSRDASGVARWTSAAAMDEIHLVGGPLQVWRDRAGDVETLVYLHEGDAGLASRYLAATAQYLEMYRSLIGPYPYGKSALVENFWETGYGMPSFTLLGPSIIRFPFILTSSYPHEILHNWWGNSVFVDYAGGNWSEGLTAYLADHLIQEQQGRGADHRRATLQKYASYVKTGRDFALAAFRSRDSASTEAVGYGKTLMGFHMLRLRLGDDGFRRMLVRLYQDFRGARASFADLQRVAEAVAGTSLDPFFRDLVTRPGAPSLAVDAQATRTADGHLVRATIWQTQEAPPFAFDVPVVLQTTGGTQTALARFEGRTAVVDLSSPGPPLALHVDPAFDVFRTLDPREFPPSIGQLFGESRVTAVLPAAASEAERQAWAALIDSWRTDTHAIDLVSDRDVEALPADRAVWLLGRHNRLAPSLVATHAGVRLDGDALVLDGRPLPLAGHAAVVVLRHPSSAHHAVGWILNEHAAAFAGLGRKLPHYGRYSYLGFEGDEPVNTVKGEWATTDSPLAVDLRPADGRATRLPPLAAPARPALIDPPPVFSSAALADHVAWLAAPAREGRGIGTPGLTATATYIADRFAAYGLSPGGDEDTFFQTVPIARGPEGQPVRGVNVIGVLAGSRPEWRAQSAIVSAHYDHLGRGWPSARAGDAGAIHPGADDNASGVAVLLELARVLAAAGALPRTVIFAAFTGEEAGLRGARAYVSAPGAYPIDQIMGVVNIDTVGRLGGGALSVLGAGTASEWPHIFRGAGFVTGVETTSVAGNAEASDQHVFIERGIPAVQLFTGPHGDYHRPGDTADKVDVAGLAKVAAVAREAVAHLADRATPLTPPGGGAAVSGGATPPGGGEARPGEGNDRRVTFGAVPDFAFSGTGVRLGDVVAGSPAALAGLTAGDVIVRIGESSIGSLREFAALLRTLQPGQQVGVGYVRDGVEHAVTLAVIAR